MDNFHHCNHSPTSIQIRYQQISVEQCLRWLRTDKIKRIKLRFDAEAYFLIVFIIWVAMQRRSVIDGQLHGITLQDIPS